MGIVLVSNGGCRGIVHCFRSGIGNMTRDSGYGKKQFQNNELCFN